MSRHGTPTLAGGGFCVFMISYAVVHFHDHLAGVPTRIGAYADMRMADSGDLIVILNRIVISALTGGRSPARARHDHLGVIMIN